MAGDRVRAEFWVTRDPGSQRQSSERCPSKRIALDLARMWVESPIRDRPRTAQGDRLSDGGNVDTVAQFESPAV